MKRAISLCMAIFLCFSTMPIGNVLAAADITLPTFESIDIDQTSVMAGDSVKISVHAKDDVGIKSVSVFYKTPITQKSFSVPLNYNAESNTYEGFLSIGSTFEPGEYKVWFVSIYDTSDNKLLFDDPTQLAGGNFTVSGTNADTTLPLFKSIQVDQKEVTAGDTVKISVNASDDVAVKSVTAFYKTPITQKSFSVPLKYNAESHLFEGTLSIPDTFESGLYKVWFVSIYDTSDNKLIFEDTSQLDAGSFTVSGTNADVTLPAFESIQVSKKRVTIGDTIKIGVKAKDNVGIKSVSVFYKSPITQKSFSVPLKYNSQTSTYEGALPIQATFEEGVYKAWFVSIYDTSDNKILFEDTSQIANGDFTFFSESNPPSFSNLSIDKTVTESGDSVKITVDATDDTNVKDGKVTYLSPVSHTKVEVPLSLDGSHFTGEFKINQNTEVGEWKVDTISITDTNENSALIKADETDLSKGTFTVIEGVPALDYRVVSSNETWSNMTVTKDVYILPGARLSIDGNVTITGDVYILGGLRVYGGLRSTGSLIGKSFTFGYYTPVDGQGVISGSNSISSMTATNQVLSDIPFELYNQPIVSSNGKVNISGATVPVVSLEINGQRVALKSNGTFRLNDFTIGDQTSLQVKSTDLYGYTHSFTYDVAEIFVDEMTKKSTAITGRTQANMKVHVLLNDQVLANGNSDENGYFSIPVSGLVENAKMTFQVVNSEGTVVATRSVVVKDTTAPGKPVVNPVSDKDRVVTGKTESGATVKVKDTSGTVIGTGIASSNGAFALEIPTQKAGTSLAVSAVDKAGNMSEATSIMVQDATGPEKPYVFEEVTDQDTVIKGSSEPGATVVARVNSKVIGSYVAEDDGYFAIPIANQKAESEITVRATDKAGNLGGITTLVVKDVTAPANPTVNEVTDKDKVITGTTEPNAIVEVEGGDWNGAYQTHADENGNFAVTISTAQIAGTKLKVVAIDKEWHISEPTVIVVKDATAPAMPVVKQVTNRDTIVKGTAETGSKIMVAVDGTVIGKGSVGKDGTFSAEIPAQAVGVKLNVTATDSTGNVSKTVSVTVSKAQLVGWVNENGIWYYYDPATHDVKVGWYKVGSSWYFAERSGAMKTGWLKDGGTWYYLSGSGAMKTGWLKDGASWYYLSGSGAMNTGWLKDGASWYYLNSSGAMNTGWLKSGTVWYYLKSSGAMATGWIKIGGKSYYFDSNGVWKK